MQIILISNNLFSIILYSGCYIDSNKRRREDGKCCYDLVSKLVMVQNIGPIKKKRRLIDVRHMHAFLIVFRIVHNLSTKLQKGVLHDHLGQNQEMSLINFITRFGYAT